MRKVFKNSELKIMLNSLKDVLKHNGKAGYAAARNTRLIQDALTEYMEEERKLVLKYGTKEKDENGNETGSVRLSIESPGFSKFLEELEQYMEIEHEVNIMQVEAADLEKLTGEEILAIDWMIKEG